MKKIIQNLTLIVILVLSILLFRYKNYIKAATEIKNLGDIRIGDVFKNGDIIPYNNGFNVCDIKPSQYCYIEKNATIFVYVDENDNEIQRKLHKGPYENGEETPVEQECLISDDYTEYWQLDRIYLSSSVIFVFAPYTYEKPEFNLTCNPNETKAQNYSLCSLKVKSSITLEDINFELDIKDYEILEVTSGDFFEKITINDGVYSTKLKENIAAFKGKEEITVATFKFISNENKIIDSENNIKIKNINCTDRLKNNIIDDIAITLKQIINEKYVTPTDDNEVNEGKNTTTDNPKTGDNSYLILYAIAVFFISIIIYSIINKKDKYEI